MRSANALIHDQFVKGFGVATELGNTSVVTDQGAETVRLRRVVAYRDAAAPCITDVDLRQLSTASPTPPVKT